MQPFWLVYQSGGECRKNCGLGSSQEIQEKERLESGSKKILEKFCFHGEMPRLIRGAVLKQVFWCTEAVLKQVFWCTEAVLKQVSWCTEAVLKQVSWCTEAVLKQVSWCTEAVLKQVFWCTEAV